MAASRSSQRDSALSRLSSPLVLIRHDIEAEALSSKTTRACLNGAVISWWCRLFGTQEKLFLIMTCPFPPCIFPGRPWDRSPRYLRYLTDGVEVSVGCSRYILRQYLNGRILLPIIPFHAIRHQSQQNLQVLRIGIEAIRQHEPLNLLIWYQHLGIGKEQFHQALWTVHRASRNDKTFWEGSAANSPIPDSPSRLHVYNRTRRLPPEVEADPLACFLQNHRVRSTAT